MKIKCADRTTQPIEDSILFLRGQKVILDRSLAALYYVETRVLNQAVQRNRKRFPPDFMFSLTRDEIRNISQTVICPTIKHSKNVYTFTQEGVAMLSSILRSHRAIEVNIAIMRTFVRLRQILFSHKDLVLKLRELEDKIEKHDEAIQAVFAAIRNLMKCPEPPRRRIDFYP